jgi:peptidoglycan/LPS O-acetylase OafA/YrhL
MASAAPRLPSLDGLRAVCISLVIFAHLIGTLGFPAIASRQSIFWAQMTALGVRTFFVMSGFLITTILLNELRRTGSVSLFRFYLRRTLRIFPVLYAYALFLVIARHFGLIQLRRWDLLALLTFTTNYHRDRSWYAGHTWSLGIEEQFYLLWPLALRTFDEKNLQRLSWAVIALAPCARIGLYIFAPSFRGGIGETYPTVADTLATGCLLALLHDRLDKSPRYLSFLASWAFWLVPLAVFACAAEPSEGLRFLVGETIMNVGLAVFIDRLTRLPDQGFARALNSRALIAIGVASYSLFLWQQPFMSRLSDALIPRFPLNLAVTLVVGFASYRLIERPIGRLRRHWERSWGAPRAQEAASEATAGPSTRAV